MNILIFSNYEYSNKINRKIKALKYIIYSHESFMNFRKNI